MNIFKWLRDKTAGKPDTTLSASALIAKERLQIVISNNRSLHGTSPKFIQMQQELIEIMAKYLNLPKDSITVGIETQEGHSILNFTFPASPLE
jgi:cell division topological specificity factor